MRRLFLVLAVVGFFVSLSPLAQAAGTCGDEGYGSHVKVRDDDFFPWPMRLIRPFPWGDVQGVWKVEDATTGETWYFALKRLRVTPSCERPLQVKQIDGVTCKVMASGVGFDRNKVIRAQMTARDGKTFRLAFTAFNQEDAPVVPVEGKIHVDSVVVLSIANVDSPLHSDVRHMQIVKVSNALDIRACTQDIKK